MKWMIGVLFLFLLPSFAFGFRGAQDLETIQPPETFLSSFPGLLDSSVVPQGKWVVELPSLAVDHGVTSRLTMGINGGGLAHRLNPRWPIALIKARYLFFSSHSHQSAVSLYASSWADAIYDKASLYGMTQTNSFRVSRQGLILLQGMLWTSFQSFKNERFFKNRSQTDLLLGLGYQHFIHPSFALELQLLVDVLKEKSASSTTTHSRFSDELQFFGGRFMVHFQLQTFSALSVGVMHLNEPQIFSESTWILLVAWGILL